MYDIVTLETIKMYTCLVYLCFFLYFAKQNVAEVLFYMPHCTIGRLYFDLAYC